MRRAPAALLALCMSVAAALAQNVPTLHTGDTDVEEALRQSTLDVSDPLAVFRYVFDQLPYRVTVYPTENYYYFRFIHNGQPHTGNLRLAAIDRDRGKLNFVYSEELTDWRPDLEFKRVVLDTTQGVLVERVERLVYRLTFEGKSVLFALNDLSSVTPPPTAVKEGEILLGPIFDESAVRFFLVFNPRLKLFHYVLDESAAAADQFEPAAAAAPVVIGKRTGFAFYRHDGRSILVGVNRRNVELNTYYDGPFDQIPENDIAGEELRDAILAVSPEIRGEIDRLGNFNDNSGRYLIRPYLLYGRVEQLALFHRCVTDRAIKPENRALCFVVGDGEQTKRQPRPEAYKHRR